MKKFFLLFLALGAAAFAGENIKTPKQVWEKTVALKLNTSKVFTQEECNLTWEYIKKVPAKGDVDYFYKNMTYLLYFDLCRVEYNTPQYNEYHDWAQSVIPPEERDHFTGECRKMEYKMLDATEKVAFNLEAFNKTQNVGFLQLAEDYRRIMQLTAMMLNASCSAQMSAETKRTLGLLR